MNQEQFDALVAETIASTADLLVAKGREYAGSADRLANFKRGAELTDAHPLQVLLIYASKHYDSISSYIKCVAKGEAVSLSEPIDGRFDDLINYCILGKALIHDLNLPRASSSGSVAPMVADRNTQSHSGGVHRFGCADEVGSPAAVALNSSDIESGHRDGGAVHTVVAGEGVHAAAGVQPAGGVAYTPLAKAGGFRCPTCVHANVATIHYPCNTCFDGSGYVHNNANRV